MKKDEIFRLLELNGFSINKVIEKDYGAFVICTRSGIFQSEKVYSLIFYGDIYHLIITIIRLGSPTFTFYEK